MIGVNSAKRIEAIEKNLIKKFHDAEEEERKKRAKKLNEIAVASSPTTIQTSTSLVKVEDVNDRPPLTVAKAKQLENMKKRLQHKFADVYTKEVEEQREREKKYEVITKAIKEKKDEEAQQQQHKVKDWYKKERYNQIVKRFKPSISSTPERKQIGYTEDGDNEDVFLKVDEKTEAEEVLPNKSIKELMDTNVINLGAIGARYLPRASDSQFGIYYDVPSERLKIGSEPITFDFDDILISNSRFTGSEGLWKLLTFKGFVKPVEYTSDDWKAYKEILLMTNSLHQKNDPSSRRPKSSGGQKWKMMIKPVWDEINKPATSPIPKIGGSGLKRYDDKTPIEYRYIKNLNELIGRLNFIHAEEAAGNNSFHNEKLSVVKFIYDRMQELIEQPNGLKYLVRCLSALPEHAIEGSGLVNDLINKLPFELHAPLNWNLDSYNYCGPGTKLSQRLARGDKGVNPLDEACKKHDIWYRDHREAKDRWVADKVLQDVAWDRVMSPDANLNERAVALGTSGTMWLKRKLGLGLGTSVCL